jgi:hypothetical protein
MVSTFAVPVGPQDANLAPLVAGHFPGLTTVGAELQPDPGADWEGWL